MGIFMPYLVMYGPNEANVGIKGIRSDAPKEAIDAFIMWYRDNHRYSSGRMMNANDARLKKLIIDDSDQDSQLKSEMGLEKPPTILRNACCSIA